MKLSKAGQNTRLNYLQTTETHQYLQGCEIYRCWTLSASHSIRFVKFNIWWSEIIIENRNCLSEVFCKKGVLRNFAKFTGKQLCQGLCSSSFLLLFFFLQNLSSKVFLQIEFRVSGNFIVKPFISVIVSVVILMILKMVLLQASFISKNSS